MLQNLDQKRAGSSARGLALNIQAAHEGRNDNRSIAIMSMFGTSNIFIDLSSARLTSREPSWLKARSAVSSGAAQTQLKHTTLGQSLTTQSCSVMTLAATLC